MSAEPQVPSSLRPADAVSSSWVNVMPAAVQPYLRLMRLDRPIGVWLLFWPCVFGLAAGAGTLHEGFPSPRMLLYCAIGAIVMRGAGCTFNDIVDRNYDAQVARTRGRPIPSGAVSVAAAWAFTAALCLIGLLILLQFNWLTVWLGAGSLLLIAVYPFMKRVTWWPQAWLGITFNWGVLLGFAAEAGRLNWGAFVMYAGCFFWTLGYDTIYAHQDKEDDILIGVKSSALKLGPATRYWLGVFYALAFVLLLLGGLLAGLGVTFGLVMILPGLHFIWQIYTLDIDRPLLCLKIFKSNREAGALIAAACLLGALTKF